MGGVGSLVLAVIGLLLAIMAVVIGVPVLIGTVFLLIYYSIHRVFEYWMYGE